MQVTNRQIMDAFAALERLSMMSLSTELIWRIAENKNAMQGKRDAIDKARIALVNKFQVGPNHPDDVDGKTRQQRLELWGAEWDVELDRENTWVSPCTIGYEKFTVKDDPAKGPTGYRPGDLAPLIVLGIVTPPTFDQPKPPTPEPAAPPPV